MSNLQGKINKKGKAPAKSVRGLKRRRTDSADGSDSTESPPLSPCNSIHIKEEETETITMDYELEDEGIEGASGHAALGLEEIKIEHEDDPLKFHIGSDESYTTIKREEAFTTDDKCCDEGYSPGSAENLPRIDPLAVTEFLAASPGYDKEQVRAIWRQSREDLNNSIGYVQIKRFTEICTVKCVVATRTTTNNCAITYNAESCCVQSVSCDCTRKKIFCSHSVTALIWLCNRETRPGVYWMEPMVTMDINSFRISEIFGFTKETYPTNKSVMGEFVKTCQKNKILNPLMYLHDGRTEASLNKLMCKFKSKYKKLNSKQFLEFSWKNINKGYVAILEAISPEERNELEYGRITDALLHDVCQKEQPKNLIEKILFPDVEENVEIQPDLNKILEKILKQKINKCGILLMPIFAASPYGTTEKHIVHIQHSKNTTTEKKLSPKNNACVQLQMFLAKKEEACLCTVHSGNKVDVTMVKFKQKELMEMLTKATEFWQTHIFKHIATDNLE